MWSNHQSVFDKLKKIEYAISLGARKHVDEAGKVWAVNFDGTPIMDLDDWISKNVGKTGIVGPVSQPIIPSEPKDTVVPTKSNNIIVIVVVVVVGAIIGYFTMKK